MGGMKDSIAGVFGAVTVVNVVAFVVMLVANIHDLGSVEFRYSTAGLSGGEFSEFSLYDLLSAVAALFATLVLVSIVAFGFGVSSSGVSTLFQWVSLSILYELFAFGTGYWMGVYPPLATGWSLVSTAMLVLYVLVAGADSSSD